MRGEKSEYETKLYIRTDNLCGKSYGQKEDR